ncbi:MAG: HAD family hydrolase [Tissierellia bacterium]|nr:HAD family hydrolase [Tissierellia bacterium]
MFNIIFDLDETLVESLKASDELFDFISKKYDFDLPIIEFRLVLRQLLVDFYKKYSNAEFMKYGMGINDLFMHPNIDKYLPGIDIEKAKVNLLKQSFRLLDMDYGHEDAVDISRDMKIKWLDFYEPVKGASETIEKLKNGGAALFILTNGFSYMQRKKAERCLNTELFDGIYISEELGIGKPDKIVFETIIEREKLDRKNTVMIGDRYNSDFIPAQKAGFKAVLFDRYNRNREKIEKVHSLTEFCELIERDNL